MSLSFIVYVTPSILLCKLSLHRPHGDTVYLYVYQYIGVLSINDQYCDQFITLIIFYIRSRPETSRLNQTSGYLHGFDILRQENLDLNIM